MFPKIDLLLKELLNNFDSISYERKLVLKKLGNYINAKIDIDEEINLVYICTHNSRRSHFGQIAAAIAADFYGIKNIKCYSGGTQITTFNHIAIRALQNLGCIINTTNIESNNPVYEVAYSASKFEICYSKLYNDTTNPKLNFVAIITCSDAEQNCPLINGADCIIGTTYKDPKEADNTPLANQTYKNRFKQIATETLYAFSLINNQKNNS